MTQISSMTGPVSSLRAQLRAQAETALAPEVNNTPFTNRMSNALKEVAEAQNQAAGITKAYELGMENDISKVMVSQEYLIGSKTHKFKVQDIKTWLTQL